MIDPPIRVSLRRSRAARRLSLSVSHIDGKARLTLPLSCSRVAAEAFIKRHSSWLENAVGRAPKAEIIGLGRNVPYLGAAHRIIRDPACKVVRRAAPNRLLVGGNATEAGPRVLAWLKEQARANLLERSTHHAARLGVEFTKLSIRDTRSRWGSCSSNGSLSYSWRLILAPKDVLDYVAAHEVAHLLEMNHSPKFWAHVEGLRPDWRDQRDWLRRNGADLHKYRLADPTE